MDRRSNAPEESGFLKDLKAEEHEEDYDDQVMINGKSYRIPYKMVKEVTFSDLNPYDLKDIPYSARLQYRLLLLDSVLKAKVEFVRNRIIITYNPRESKNRKEKTSREELMQFLSKEGVTANAAAISERDVDYVEEIYKYQFEPASIREHAPYGYTRDEWKSMKPEWEKRQKEAVAAKYDKFRRFQDSFLEQHPDLANMGVKRNFSDSQQKTSLLGKMLGKGKNDKDKGFWFHGV